VPAAYARPHDTTRARAAPRDTPILRRRAPAVHVVVVVITGADRAQGPHLAARGWGEVDVMVTRFSSTRSTYFNRF